ncbi:MAG: hypothetical protein ABI083_11860 [Lapillicoccus sp.]
MTNETEVGSAESAGSKAQNWAEAVSDVIGSSPDTDAAVDVNQGHADAHRAAGDELQQAIAAVAQQHLGSSREIITDALRRELEARGRWPQPQPWLNSVAADLEAGQTYQVGTD